MNEFKYYDIPSPFPTLARGLFTVDVTDKEGQEKEKEYRIVARGYDKFFNIGEVPWTTVRGSIFVVLFLSLGRGSVTHASTRNLSIRYLRSPYDCYCSVLGPNRVQALTDVD